MDVNSLRKVPTAYANCSQQNNLPTKVKGTEANQLKHI